MDQNELAKLHPEIRSYRALRTVDTATDAQNVIRGMRYLPPISEGLTEAEREQLLMRYTEMLTKLDKFETAARQEIEKNGRVSSQSYATIFKALMGNDAARTTAQGGTMQARTAGATERVRMLLVQAETLGTPTVSTMRSKHLSNVSALADSITRDPNTGEMRVRDGATDNFQAAMSQLMEGATGRETIPTLKAVASIAGGTVEDISTLFRSGLPLDAATAKKVDAYLELGMVASEESAAQDARIYQESTDAIDDMKSVLGGSESWKVDAATTILASALNKPINGVQPSALGSAVIEGDGGTSASSGGPDTKGFSQSQSSQPYLEETRQQILSEIERLRDPTEEAYIVKAKQIKATPQYQKFLADMGREDNRDTWHLFLDTADRAFADTRRERIAKDDRAIVNGDIKVTAPREAVARVRSGIRDLFAGKRKAEADPVSPEVATPESEKVEPAANITAGSSPSVPSAVESSGGDSKEKSDAPKASSKYRVVSDPRNPDYIYRQYDDGKIELIGSPDHPSVSPKNPRPMTGTARSAVEASIGAYTEDDGKGPITLDEADPGFDADMATAAGTNTSVPKAKTPKPPKQDEPTDARTEEDFARDITPTALVEMTKAKNDGIKQTAGGPGLALRNGEVAKVAEPKKKDDEPAKVEPESKGKIDSSRERVDALMKGGQAKAIVAPGSSTGPASKSVELPDTPIAEEPQAVEPEAKGTISTGAPKVSRADMLRRQKLRESLAQ